MLDVQATAVETVAPVPVKRMSWAAVAAGAVVIVVVQLVLSLLGLGIGAGTVDPLEEQRPLAGIGMGAGIWMLVVTLVALFAGGWVSGRLAGMPRKLDGGLHGIVTWGLATIVTVYLLGTAVGSLASGALGAVGQAGALIGRGVSAMGPAAANVAKRELAEEGVNWDTVKNEAKKVLSQTGKADLQPGALQGAAQGAVGDAKSAAGAAIRDPLATDTQVQDLLKRVVERGERAADAADRDALVNLVTARGNMSRAEASETVARWEAGYQRARTEFEQTKARADQTAREAGDAAARGVSRAALWAFLGLMLGGIAAAVGGVIGSPKDLVGNVGGPGPLSGSGSIPAEPTLRPRTAT